MKLKPLKTTKYQPLAGVVMVCLTALGGMNELRAMTPRADAVAEIKSLPIDKARIDNARPIVIDVVVDARDIVTSVAWADYSLEKRKVNQGQQITMAADVLFEFDKAELSTQAKTRIDDVASQINSSHPKSVTVDGYTDSLGSITYNNDLSARRAQSVKDALTQLLNDKAVPMTAVGHGPDNPVVSNTLPDGSDNPAGRARNRRVTVTLQP